MRVTVLDGGLGHLLKASVASSLPFDQQFRASAQANADADGGGADAVLAAHAAYLAAGAEVITTNTFACTRHALSAVGRAHDAAALCAAAGRLARRAAEASGRAGGVRVAGSLPPLRESYQSDGLDAPDEARRQYEELAGALAPHVDVLLAETLSTLGEALAAAAATAGRGGAATWVSFTIDDDGAGREPPRLRGGELLTDAARALVAEAPHVEAVLVNCCAPAAAAAAVPVLRAALPAHVRVGAYANGFRKTTSEWLREAAGGGGGSGGGDGGGGGAGGGGGGGAGGASAAPAAAGEGDYDASGIITPAAYARFARGWVEAGASIVGGCCGVGPEHIAVLARELAGG